MKFFGGMFGNVFLFIGPVLAWWENILEILDSHTVFFCLLNLETNEYYRDCLFDVNLKSHGFCVVQTLILVTNIGYTKTFITGAK